MIITVIKYAADVGTRISAPPAELKVQSPTTSSRGPADRDRSKTTSFGTTGRVARGTRRLTRAPRRISIAGRSALHGGGVEGVEEEPERSVRLRAEGDLGAEKEELPAPHVGLRGGDAVLKALLSPRPSAAQRPRAVEPGDAAHAPRRRVRPQPHHRALVEHHVGVVLHPPGGGLRGIDRDAQDG